MHAYFFVEGKLVDKKAESILMVVFSRGVCLAVFLKFWSYLSKHVGLKT
jgi:hypothetical protein